MEYDIDVVRIVKQVKANEYIAEHEHHNIYHYIFILYGTGRVSVGGKVYDTPERALFVIPPGVRHAVYGTGELCAIDIKFRVGGMLEQVCEFGTYRFDTLGSYEMTLIMDMLDEAVMCAPNFRNIINTKMLELLMRLRRPSMASDCTLPNMESLSDARNGVRNDQLEKIRAALEYVDNNLDKPLSVAKLSEISGYSCTHFSQLFKSAVGLSPKRYVNLKKIGYAKRMLLSSHMNITQISEMLGYESIHYFSRIFKHITGITPSSYYDSANSDMGINLLEGYVQLSDDGFEFQKLKLDDRVPLPEITETAEKEPTKSL